MISRTRILRLLLVTTTAAFVWGCSSGPAKAPTPKKPIAERRALEIIARGIGKEKMTPEEGRSIKIPGASLKMDVGVKNRKFGIAYITENDLDEKGSDRIPRKDPKRPKALVLVEGTGDEADTKCLVLFDTDYLADDSTDEYKTTTITAEAALERDVRDFVVQAKANKWE